MELLSVLFQCQLFTKKTTKNILLVTNGLSYDNQSFLSSQCNFLTHSTVLTYMYKTLQKYFHVFKLLFRLKGNFFFYYFFVPINIFFKQSKSIRSYFFYHVTQYLVHEQSWSPILKKYC